jgi:hypothetical protein
MEKKHHKKEAKHEMHIHEMSCKGMKPKTEMHKMKEMHEKVEKKRK